MQRFKNECNLDCIMKHCNSRAKKRARIIAKGSDRIGKQLDVVSFIRKQMLLDTLIKAQFSPLERFLATRQYKSFVLDSAKSSDSESNSDQEFKRAQKLMNGNQDSQLGSQ